METATFGAGCFWGVEHTFKKVPGVIETAVGYSGGSVENPTYEQVCTDTTGHAEVVQLKYDPEVVTYAQLLEKFWHSHDPTTLNRQGPDRGKQYRSVIFYHSDAQKSEAQASLKAHQSKFSDPIVTEISPSAPFYRAEEYHQCYLQKKGR